MRVALHRLLVLPNRGTMKDMRSDDEKTGGDQNANEGGQEKKYVALPDKVLDALHNSDLVHFEAVSALPFSD